MTLEPKPGPIARPGGRIMMGQNNIGVRLISQSSKRCPIKCIILKLNTRLYSDVDPGAILLYRTSRPGRGNPQYFFGVDRN